MCQRPRGRPPLPQYRGSPRGRRLRQCLLRQCGLVFSLAAPRSFRGVQQPPSPRFKATRSTPSAASCRIAPYGFATPGLERIVSAQTTDKSGFFEFRDLDPGSYIVELLGVADTVLAASQLININAAETVPTVVQLPFRLPALGGLLGHTTVQAIATRPRNRRDGTARSSSTPRQTTGPVRRPPRK